jgi:hypothetical protein
MLGLLIVLGTVAAAPAKAPLNTCIPKEACRYVGDVEVKTKAGSRTAQVGGWVPYIDNGVVDIFLGETVVIRVIDDGRGGMKPVLAYGGRADQLPRDARDDRAQRQMSRTQQQSAKEEQLHVIHDDSGISAIDAQKDTVRYTLTQVEDAAHTVVLQITNGYDHTIEYRAKTGYPDGQRQSTTVCPAIAVTTMESWSDPVVEMDLSGFSLLPPRHIEDLKLSECK